MTDTPLPVDLSSADLEMNGSIYEGFSTAIMIKGEPRTVALCREFSDAVQLMAIIQRDRATLPIIVELHRDGILSEGQVSAATALDRVDIRQRVNAIGKGPGRSKPDPTPQTPSTDRPLTAGDVALLREGDVIQCQDRGQTKTHEVRSMSSALGGINVDGGGMYAPYLCTFVSRPAPVPEAGEGVEPAAWTDFKPGSYPPLNGEWFVARCPQAVRVVHYADKSDRLPIDHTGWAWPSLPTHWMRLSDFITQHAGGVK